MLASFPIGPVVMRLNSHQGGLLLMNLRQPREKLVPENILESTGSRHDNDHITHWVSTGL